MYIIGVTSKHHSFNAGILFDAPFFETVEVAIKERKDDEFDKQMKYNLYWKKLPLTKLLVKYNTHSKFYLFRFFLPFKQQLFLYPLTSNMYSSNTWKVNLLCMANFILVTKNTNTNEFDVDEIENEFIQGIENLEGLKKSSKKIQYTVFRNSKATGSCEYEAVKFCKDLCSSNKPDEVTSIIEIKRDMSQQKSCHEYMAEIIYCLYKYLHSNEVGANVYSTSIHLSVYHVKNKHLESFWKLNQGINSIVDSNELIFFDLIPEVHNTIIECLELSYTDLLLAVTAKSADNIMANTKDGESIDLVIDSACGKMHEEVICNLESGKFLVQFAEKFDEMLKFTMTTFQNSYIEKHKSHYDNGANFSAFHFAEFTMKSTEKIMDFFNLVVGPKIVFELTKKAKASKTYEVMPLYTNILRKKIYYAQLEHNISPTVAEENAEKYNTFIKQCQSNLFKYMKLYQFTKLFGLVKPISKNLKTSPMYGLAAIKIVCCGKLTIENNPLLCQILSNISQFLNEEGSQLIYIDMKKAMQIDHICQKLQDTPAKNASKTNMLNMRKPHREIAEKMELYIKRVGQEHINLYKFPLHVERPPVTRIRSIIRHLGFSQHDASSLPQPKILRPTKNTEINLSKLKQDSDCKKLQIDLTTVTRAHTFSVESYLDHNKICNLKLKRLSFLPKDFLESIVASMNFESIDNTIISNQTLVDHYYTELRLCLHTLQHIPSLTKIEKVYFNFSKFSSWNELYFSTIFGSKDTYNILVAMDLEQVQGIFFGTQEANKSSHAIPCLSISFREIINRHVDPTRWQSKCATFVKDVFVEFEELGELLDVFVLSQKCLYVTNWSEIDYFMPEEYQISVYAVAKISGIPSFYIMMEEPENKSCISPFNFAMDAHNKCLENTDVITEIQKFDTVHKKSEMRISTVTLIFETILRLKFDILGNLKQQYEERREEFTAKFCEVANEYFDKLPYADNNQIDEITINITAKTSGSFEDTMLKVLEFVESYQIIHRKAITTRLMITSFSGLSDADETLILEFDSRLKCGNK